jgi:hypothetical protein
MSKYFFCPFYRWTLSRKIESAYARTEFNILYTIRKPPPFSDEI